MCARTTLKNTHPFFKGVPFLFENVFQILSAQPCLAVLPKRIVIKEAVTKTFDLSTAHVFD